MFHSCSKLQRIHLTHVKDKSSRNNQCYFSGVEYLYQFSPFLYPVIGITCTPITNIFSVFLFLSSSIYLSINLSLSISFYFFLALSLIDA